MCRGSVLLLCLNSGKVKCTVPARARSWVWPPPLQLLSPQPPGTWALAPAQPALSKADAQKSVRCETCVCVSIISSPQQRMSRTVLTKGCETGQHETPKHVCSFLKLSALKSPVCCCFIPSGAAVEKQAVQCQLLSTCVCLTVITADYSTSIFSCRHAVWIQWRIHEHQYGKTAHELST